MKTSFILSIALTMIMGNALSGRPSDPAPVNDPLNIPDDIMEPVGKDLAPGSDSTTISSLAPYILPILFVPSDLATNPYGLRYIDQRMQLIQRWYAEQLRGITFTIAPAIVIKGNHPLSHYYGSCYPPDSSCSWPYEMWSIVFTELSSRGYPWQSNRVLGVFFQNNGMGAPALGGEGEFLVALDADNNRLNGDCLESGCAASVSKGGAAHELGHAFTLPHTYDDPEGSPGLSLMNYGFYGFPQCTLVNTATNAERDILLASSYFNTNLNLTDGGFEDCTSNWSVESGSTSCSSTPRFSGLGALTLNVVPGSTNRLMQRATVIAQRTYDISGWVDTNNSDNYNLTFKIEARSSSEYLLDSLEIAGISGPTNGWRRFAYSYTTPSLTTSLRLYIIASGTESSQISIDDLDIHESLAAPPLPLQFFYTDGDSVPGVRPTLIWENVTNATDFQIQISRESAFGHILIDEHLTTPVYQPASDLSEGTRYFWRVRAKNGTGTSDWSSTWSFLTAGAEDYLSDEFEEWDLNPAWSWVREDAANWGIGGPPGRRYFGYMGITAQAGDIYRTYNNAENLLLKNPPEGAYDISTKIDFWGGISKNYQQAGLLIYQDDDNYLKLFRGYNNGNELRWMAEVNGLIVENTSIRVWSNPPIRISRDGENYIAKYSADGITWSTLGQPVNVGWNNPRIGLAAFSTSDTDVITAYFDYFRVSVPPKFADVPYNYWAWNWIDLFFDQGITTGCAASPAKYCPDRQVTRAEMAVFILRAKNGTATPVPVTTDLFADVPVASKEWMKPWIEEFYNEGITTGCAVGPLQYCPERQVTRAEMAVFVLRAIHGPDYVPPAATGVFSDVPVAGKAWMQPWIEQFYNEGITTGCASSPLRYCPEQSVTRAEMAVFIDRAFGY